MYEDRPLESVNQLDSRVTLLQDELDRERRAHAEEREAAFRKNLAQAEEIGALVAQLKGARAKAATLETELESIRAAHAVALARTEANATLASELDDARSLATRLQAEIAGLQRIYRLEGYATLRAELDGLEKQITWLENEAGPVRISTLERRHTAILASLRRPEPIGSLPPFANDAERVDYLLIARSGLFDREWYEATYPDVPRNALDPVRHYMSHGWREGRDPGPAFHGDDYLIANPDVVRDGSNPLIHYLRYGQYEDRPIQADRALGRLLSDGRAGSAPAVGRSGATRTWFFVGDTLEWLRHHPHLTGVGRVTAELLFAALDSPATPILMCVVGRGVGGLIRFEDGDALKALGDNIGVSADDFPVMESGAEWVDGDPRPGDHIVFTGVVWTENYERLFRHLRAVGISFSVLVHDIIPALRPDLVAEDAPAQFERWLRTLLSTASTILVSNQAVAEDVHRWALAARIEIAGQVKPVEFGVRTLAPSLSSSEPRIGRDYVLSVGTLDTRKNQIALLQIWADLIAKLGVPTVPTLVLAGRDDLGLSAAPEFAALLRNGQVRLIEGADNAEIADLYRGCLFTAFPSRSEGYGMPVAESLAYGKLCLAADLREIRAHAGDLVWYFDPDDRAAATALFTRALVESDARTAAEAAIGGRYVAPSWRESWSRMHAAIADGGSRRRSSASTGNLRFTGSVSRSPGSIVRAAARWCTRRDPIVSILIVNWNASGLTLDCVRQIWAHTEGVRYEIIIVDNGSSEEDLRALRNLGDGIRLIELGCNRYFGEANNIAAEAAAGEYVCFLNNDAFVEPGWLAALLRPFETSPDVGATGPLFLYPDRRIQEAGVVVNAEGYPIRYARDEPTLPLEFIERRVVDYVSAAALVVERSLFFDVGGFDMAFEPAYYEDTDLCFKLRAHGRKVIFEPAAVVVHIEGSSANGDAAAERRRVHLGDLNRAKFVARWRDYLKDRDEKTVARIGRRLMPVRATIPASPVGGRPRALVYSPFNLTPGGGERYLLTLASSLSRTHDVTFATLFPYSNLRLQSIGAELGLDVETLKLRSRAEFSEHGPVDLHITMGNHIVPDVVGQGRVNLYHCQFPFPLHRPPTAQEREALASYGAIIVNSDYTALHAAIAINGNQLPDIPVHVLYPPVSPYAPAIKNPTILLSVGRFFTGGHSKRQDRLVEAFKRLLERSSQPLELHLAGSSTPNDESMAYLAEVVSATIGYPIFVHVNCSGDTLRQLYGSAGIYWHGTGLGADLVGNPACAEHFGISTVEAMSAGAVPFVLRSGGAREIVQEGLNGFLYDDEENLVDATARFLAMTAEEQLPIRNAAIAAARRYSVERFAEDFRKLIDLHETPASAASGTSDA